VTFVALWHLILVGGFYVACDVAAVFVVVWIVIFLCAKGSWRERIRNNFGGGT
jgi:hypothetical protein